MDFIHTKRLPEYRGEVKTLWGLPEKLRDMHFDVLIALTARNHGATVITSNKTDFELIRR